MTRCESAVQRRVLPQEDGANDCLTLRMRTYNVSSMRYAHDIQHDLEAERACNRRTWTHQPRCAYEREGDEAETTIVRLTAELAEARAGILKLPY